MRKNLFFIIFAAAIGASGCSFNIGTGANVANAPAAAHSPAAAAPANSASAATNAANAAKSPEPAKPAASGADDPKSENEQIQFAKGTTETTLDRTIAPGVNKMYTFNAKKGQRIYIEATEETGQLEVDFNKQPIELGDNFQYQLNASGDWAIYVNNPGSKTLKYKLFVGID
ncbi:MAG: hypothetical protein QM785_10200 [Pyrinomonadaceae bacterium]